MLRLHLLRMFAVSACLTAVACSNGNHKKKPIGNDASTYDGSADGNGAGGSDAGVDAPMEAAPEAAPEAQADAPMDSPSEPEAGLICTTGTIKDYAQNICLSCPFDAGVEGGTDSGALDGSVDATSDASVDPYLPAITCNGVLGSAFGSYDPTTGMLDIQLAYPLDIVQVTIGGDFDSNGAYVSSFSLQNMSITDNHIMLSIGTPPVGAGVDSVVVYTLIMTDACGRITSYYSGGGSCVDIKATPADSGTTWTVSCVPFLC